MFVTRIRYMRHSAHHQSFIVSNTNLWQRQNLRIFNFYYFGFFWGEGGGVDEVEHRVKSPGGVFRKHHYTSCRERVGALYQIIWLQQRHVNFQGNPLHFTLLGFSWSYFLSVDEPSESHLVEFCHEMSVCRRTYRIDKLYSYTVVYSVP